MRVYEINGIPKEKQDEVNLALEDSGLLIDWYKETLCIVDLKHNDNTYNKISDILKDDEAIAVTDRVGHLYAKMQVNRSIRQLKKDGSKMQEILDVVQSLVKDASLRYEVSLDNEHIYEKIKESYKRSQT